MYEATSDRLKKIFYIDKETMGGIGFTTDIWTSRSKIAFQLLVILSARTLSLRDITPPFLNIDNRKKLLTLNNK